ncbi:MAG: DUF1992 domain-containing protein [Geodermatophilaceae bacterium]|nr:DUF1992 domain-containing protein [Geodermatophilaceae bacterium]
MSERKPAGLSFETWVDRAIREAEEQGSFADLPGFGKPIPGAGKPDDELWWVKAKLEREKLAFIPPSLALRKDVDEVHDQAEARRSEDAVRDLVADLNTRIVAANRIGISGPPITVMPLDPDRVLAVWRAGRTASSSANRPAEAALKDPEPRPRRLMFRRRRSS